MNPRTGVGDSRRKHYLLLHLIWTGRVRSWAYGGHKMAPGNEANTGTDRTEPREKIALMISFEPQNQPMLEARLALDFSTLQVNKFPCACLSLSRLGFYL